MQQPNYQYYDPYGQPAPNTGHNGPADSDPRYANARYLLGMGPMPPPSGRDMAVGYLQHAMNNGAFQGQGYAAAGPPATSAPAPAPSFRASQNRQNPAPATGSLVVYTALKLHSPTAQQYPQLRVYDWMSVSPLGQMDNPKAKRHHLSCLPS